MDALVVRVLSGPPAPGFDCGRQAQNEFFYLFAWLDQQQRLSATHVYQREHPCAAAFVTLCADAVILGTREKAAGVRFKYVSALKLAQMGVHLAFQGAGLGMMIVADVVRLALELSQRIGCRYVTLDAEPDLVGWYERQGFVVNRALQKQREEAAAKRGAGDIAVSMRFDLREV